MGAQDASKTPHVLVADDEVGVLKALRLLLKPEDYEVAMAPSASAVLEAVREGDFDVLLIDLNYVRGHTSGQEGLDLLARL